MKKGSDADAEIREPMVMAVDPGGTIGYAVAPLGLRDLPGSMFGPSLAGSMTVGEIVVSECFPRDSGSVRWTKEVEAVYRLLERMRSMNVRVLVPESYQVRGGARKGADVLAPARQLAMLDFALANKWWEGCLFSQPSSSALSVVTDERLHSLGLWTVGLDHGRSATKHLVLFFRRLAKGEVELPW